MQGKGELRVKEAFVSEEEKGAPTHKLELLVLGAGASLLRGSLNPLNQTGSSKVSLGILAF